MAVPAVRVPLKTVALPNEHGAWGFLIEPALLSMLLQPSWAGAWLALAALAALLTQHPLGLVLADLRRGRSYPRTRVALRFVAGYGLLACASLAGAVAGADDLTFLLPAVVAAPLALVQLALDARNQGRSAAAELAGATAITTLAPAVILVGGGGPLLAAAIWLMLVARNLSSILYVRSRLRLEYGRPANLLPARLAQPGALALVTWPVLTGPLPFLTLAAFVLLAARALIGLSPARTPTAPKWIGIRELGFGLLVVLLTAAGALLP